MKRRAVSTTEEIITLPANDPESHAGSVPVPPLDVPVLLTEPVRRPSRAQAKGKQSRSKSTTVQSNVQLQDDPKGSTNTTDITVQELKALVKSHGMQSAAAVCPLIHESFRHCVGQREISLLIMNTAMELARQNRRKRILVHDVEPLVTMMKQLFVIAGYGRVSGEQPKSV